MTPVGVIWWFPGSAQPVDVWLQELVVNAAAVEWQLVQFEAAKVVPALECTGLFVPL